MIRIANARQERGGEYIGRACYIHTRSPLANPFSVKQYGRAGAIKRYRDWLMHQMQSDTPARREIERLTNLARAGDLTLLCWCAPLACHGDVVKQAIELCLRDTHCCDFCPAPACAIVFTSSEAAYCDTCYQVWLAQQENLSGVMVRYRLPQS